jgi:hypothetical protein
MRSLVWITLLLSTLSGTHVRADECETKAAEIAGQLGLDAGTRTADNSIPLAARGDEDDAYGAYLLCKGPLGMSLRYLSPPIPGSKWVEFVARSGAILTGWASPLIALEVKNCVENARLRGVSYRPPGTALRMICTVSGNDSRADVSLAKR